MMIVDPLTKRSWLRSTETATPSMEIAEEPGRTVWVLRKTMSVGSTANNSVEMVIVSREGAGLWALLCLQASQSTHARKED